MNGLPRKAEFSSILTNSSQYMLNPNKNSSKSMISLSQMLSQQNNGKSLEVPKNYSQSSFTQHLQNAVAPRPSFNTSNTQNFYKPEETSDRFSPFYTPQKTITKRINKSENTIQFKNQIDQNQQKMLNDARQSKGFSTGDNQKIDKIKDLHSQSNNINNSNLNLLNQHAASQQQVIDQKPYQYRFSQKYYTKKQDSNTTRHSQQLSLQIEPTFLSDREIQLPPIINSTKSSKFKNQNGNQSINQLTSDKSTQSQTNSSEIDSITTPLQNKQDLQKNQNPTAINKKQEYLKDWLIGSSSKNYQPVSANEIKQGSTNEILPPNSQLNQFNQRNLLNEQQKAIVSHRTYIMLKNSKEQSKIQNILDASEQLSSSQDSIQTPQSSQQSEMQQQTKPTFQSSIFKQINVNTSQSQESLPESIQRLQIQQNFSNQINSPSKNTLQQILQTPSSNSSLFSPSPTDIALQQKKAIYKPRRNKLQLWMNEVNNELGNSLVNDSNNENSINNYRKVKTEQSYLDEESEENQMQYQPSAVEQSNKQSRLSFLLPQINEEIEKNQKKSLVFLRQPLIKSSKETESANLKINNNFSLTNQFTESDDRRQLNNNHHKSSSSLLQSFNTQQRLSNEQQENVSSNINLQQQSYLIRHKSEPKLSLKILQKNTEQGTSSEQQLFDNLVIQKLEQKRVTLSDENETKLNTSTQDKTKSLNFIPNNNNTNNKMKIKFVKEVKSILKSRSDQKQYSLKTLQNINESDESEDQIQTKQSNQSTRIGNSLSSFSAISFQRDNPKGQLQDDNFAKNPKFLKKVNFIEKVQVYDIRTKQLTVTSITKQQSQNHNDEIKIKQKKQHL